MRVLTVIITCAGLLLPSLLYNSTNTSSNTSSNTGGSSGPISLYARVTPADQNPEAYWPTFLQQQPYVIARLVSDDCPKCKESQPVFDAIAAKHPEIKFVDINFRKYNFAKNITRRRRIRGLPAFLFYKNGTLIYDYKTSVSEEKLEKAIQDTFGSH